MDLSAYEENLDQAIRLSRQATERDKAGAFAEAFELYKVALDYWHVLCRGQTNALLKEKLYRKMGEYVARAEVLKHFLERQKQQSWQAYTKTPPAFASAASPSMACRSDPLFATPVPHGSSLCCSSAANQGSQPCASTPFPHLLSSPCASFLQADPRDSAKRSSDRGDGCGCTGSMQADDLTEEEKIKEKLNISSADLVSKWQGESEKLVRSLFAMARERRPSIIFIDEIDSMCGARSEGDSDSSRRIKTEFLVQMQGLQKDAPGVLVLGATNVPWALDSAIRRRFERRVYIPLPDLRARLQLVSLSLGNTPHQLGDVHFQTLAVQTEGFSGADISVVVRDALFQPLRKCRAATHFKRVRFNGTFFLTPCSPGDADSTKVEMRLMEVPPDRLLPPELSMEDFIAVLRNARPSVSEEDIRRHDEWTRRFGVEGQ
ncbi:putative vacuolar sorting ATPase Vps4 [Neospora caninum Liverpool]|uniref:Putative vacuolar sorting ATPase Vps4 n=1 Tax=Neospora caninum (strain Liverpool) TaxID=572307 RepID=F0VNW6_NEOCL|nr:putative vacuolar sorting ATPase Vps4 [Neospora caninum Liverpool]CBZ55412.1 putative vacuolar sorting ATPase Vps4 [Neospora caninum Liverpool]|eukprot:XP_003885440.1 putative vacuolar sorting ATPase Vps4 [Neospora caninum Liverpool]